MNHRWRFGHRTQAASCLRLNEQGELVGDKSVERLETDYLSRSRNVNGLPDFSGCSKRLNSLRLHVPKTNAEIPSVDEEIRDHQRLLNNNVRSNTGTQNGGMCC